MQQTAPEELPFLDAILEPKNTTAAGKAEPVPASGAPLSLEFITPTLEIGADLLASKINSARMFCQSVSKMGARRVKW